MKHLRKVNVFNFKIASRRSGSIIPLQTHKGKLGIKQIISVSTGFGEHKKRHNAKLRGAWPLTVNQWVLKHSSHRTHMIHISRNMSFKQNT